MATETSPYWLTPWLLILALAFVLVGVFTLSLTTNIPPRHLLALVGGWGVAWGGTYAVLRVRVPHADPFIVPIVALLTGWGLLLQSRLASSSFLLRQIIWLFIGCGALTLVACYPTLIRLLRRFRYSLLVAGLLLLGLTLVFGVNPSGFGQQLWLGAFGVYFQPSESLKFLLIIYLASYLCDRRNVLLHRPAAPPVWLVVLGPMLTMVGIALLLLGWQQDLGAALLFYLTFVAMLYLAWGKGWVVALSLLLFAPVAIVGYLASSRVALRVSIWLDPWSPEQVDRAFQILQSLYALAAGGVFGQGLGQGVPTFIPAVHTDFVYAALIEEFGSLGGCALLALLGLLIVRGIYWAQNTESPFESLLAGGIAALLGIQTWVIIGGNAKLIPITGVTLPYLSYGGSSLLTMMLAMGLLLNISASHPPALSLIFTPNQALPLRRTAGRLGQALLFLLVTTAISTGYWSIYRSADLRDTITNPRYILAEARIRRGRILDRKGSVLADIAVDEQGYVKRTYPVPEAAPAIGYATLQYGTDGIESTCDTRLRGDAVRTSWEIAWDQLYHQAPQGQDVWLTLDAQLQQEAQHLLAGQAGAAILVDVRTGDVLALASSPIYNPASVEVEWNTLRNAVSAPLLNRATQGLAQPGTILQSVILSTAIEQALLEAVPPAPIGANITLANTTLTCTTPPKDTTWTAALASNCPAPFATLGQTLGLAQIIAALEQWGLNDAPPLEVPTVAMVWEPHFADLTAETLGQGNLLITPLQMAGVAATVGNAGVRPALHLLASQPSGCKTNLSNDARRIVSADTAAQIRALWPRYGAVIGHLGHALAGPSRIQTWFIGLNSDSNSQYAVVVTLENPNDLHLATDIGIQLLDHAGHK